MTDTSKTLPKKNRQLKLLVDVLPDIIWWRFAGKKNFILARNFRIHSCEVSKHERVACGKKKLARVLSTKLHGL